MIPQWLNTAGFIILPHIGGICGSFITKNQVETWYKSLDKPSFRPPNWLFPPVWTALYTGMGYASYLAHRDSSGSTRKLALSVYAVHLGLNWIWTPIFFQYHKLGLATIEIGLLWASIVATIWQFYPINKYAAYLMLPYLGWVSFANFLTFSIWQRNKNNKSIKD